MGVSYKFKNGKFIERTPGEAQRLAEYFKEAMAESESRRVPKLKVRFLQITLDQAEKLRHVGTVKCVTVFLLMLEAKFQRRGGSFPMPTDFLLRHGFSLTTQSRVLLRLQKVGLISIVRVPRKPPVITVL